MKRLTALLLPLLATAWYAGASPHAANVGPADLRDDRSQPAVVRQIVEAEDGVFTGAVDQHSCWRNVMLTDAQHSTHSGKGAVDTKNEIGSHVEVVFDAQAAGAHRISVRYTHIKPDPRPGELSVNGVVVKASLTMPQTAALPAWQTASTVASLQLGRNVIRLSALKDGGLPNIDYIKVREIKATSRSELPRVQVLEAEDGVFTGTVDDHSCWQFIAMVNAPHSGPTGTGFVDTRNEVGSYVEVAIAAKSAGPHTLLVRYVHNKPDDRSAALLVNGVVANPSLAFPQTGAWTAWKVVSTPIELKTGRNVIRLTALNAEGLGNIDHFEITPLLAGSTRQFAPLKLGTLRGLALDPAGNLYVPNPNPPTLHKITPTGVVTVLPSSPIADLFAVALAPDGTIYAIDSVRRGAFRLDAQGAKPLAPAEREDLFLGPTSLVCDAAGNLYIGENDANIVRKVTPKGEITIFAGAFKQRGNQDGKGSEARFIQPRGLAIDRSGNIYVADEGASIIRKITPEGVVTTLAGSAGEKGSQDGTGPAARFSSPKGLAADASGNVFVMDSNNHTIRKITPRGVVTTVAGRAGVSGFIDGALSEARFAGPRAAALDASGNLFVADGDNHSVRMISPNGRVTTVVGVQPPRSTGQSASGSAEVLNNPRRGERR